MEPAPWPWSTDGNNSSLTAPAERGDLPVSPTAVSRLLTLVCARGEMGRDSRPAAGRHHARACQVERPDAQQAGECRRPRTQAAAGRSDDEHRMLSTLGSHRVWGWDSRAESLGLVRV